MPAPPQGSEPAMVRATGVMLSAGYQAGLLAGPAARSAWAAAVHSNQGRSARAENRMPARMRHLYVLLLLAGALFAQSQMGEMRLTVTDQSGLATTAEVELRSSSNDYHVTLQTDREGKLVAKRLPFGLYQLTVRRAGFTTYTKLLEIRSALPVELKITLEIAGVDTTVVITEQETLVDPHRDRKSVV